jgi:hypothetical protein
MSSDTNEKFAISSPFDAQQANMWLTLALVQAGGSLVLKKSTFEAMDNVELFVSYDENDDCVISVEPWDGEEHE